jgi:phosphoribosylaminoimidazole-succinocarboxamide synthase
MASVIIETNFPKLHFVKRGKVRDMYEVEDYLLIVATDRLSAYDVIMPQGIPDKGKVLTQISKFWFDQTKGIIKNHVISTNVDEFPSECTRYAGELRGRSMLVKKTRPLGIECIVRGYLSGSGWAEYREMKSVCGLPLPAGLVESSRLPAPIFTPSTKADSGHDENISAAEAGRRVGDALVARLRDLSIHVYERGARHAEARGIIVADTKFEFGLLPAASGADPTVLLIDEVLTPDSSRFWPADQYRPGRAQPSFDKQYVRDYLEAIRWNKQPPAPSLPDDVVERTRAKYVEAFERLTGRSLD